jgi:hypothetical protein
VTGKKEPGKKDTTSMNNTTDTKTLHPFEIAGMGIGPYRFIEGFDLGAARNPDSAANFGNMAGWTAHAPKLKAGLGTCCCCGRAISIICVVEDGNGDRWGVGSDCVDKAGDPHIGDKVKVAIANRTRTKARIARNARQAERRAKWLEANKDRIAAEKAEQEARNAAETARRQAILADPDKARVIEALGEQAARGSDFHASLKCQLQDTGTLSDRQADFALKAFLGRPTKANSEEWERLHEILTGKKRTAN